MSKPAKSSGGAAKSGRKRRKTGRATQKTARIAEIDGPPEGMAGDRALSGPLSALRDAPPGDDRLERARGHWQMGDWPALAQLADDRLERHPERARLTLLAAVGLAQTGDLARARHFAARALDWGCDRALVARVLIGGALNSLGRAASLMGDEPRALACFTDSIATVSPRADATLLGRARNIHEKARLGQLPEAAGLLGEAVRDPDPGAGTSERLAVLLGGLGAIEAELAAQRAAPRTHPAAPGPDRVPRAARSDTDPPFVVVVAGVPRSGSTWVFNAVRLLCERAGLTHHAVWWSDYRPAAHGDCAVHVVKLHAPDELRVTPHRILTSHRDPVERLASHVRMGWTAPEPAAIRKRAAQHAERSEYWAARSDLETRFEDIMEGPDQAVMQLAFVLDIPCSDATARAIAETLLAMPDAAVRAGPHGHDPQTLLHAGHRGTAPERARCIALVRAALAGTDP